MYRDEKEIAEKAELMLTQSLNDKTSGFTEHINRGENDTSVKDSFAKATVKKYGSTRAGTQTFYFRSLAIKMAKHGFIHHFGINTVRSGGTRTRTKPRTSTYSYQSHPMEMAPHPFINDAVDTSDVVDFVMTEVTRIRSEEILVGIRRILENP
jgi:hypothetical protein